MPASFTGSESAYPDVHAQPDMISSIDIYDRITNSYFDDHTRFGIA